MRQVYSKINHLVRCCQEQHRVNPEHITVPVSCCGAVPCEHSGATGAALAPLGPWQGLRTPGTPEGGTCSAPKLPPAVPVKVGQSLGLLHSSVQGGQLTRVTPQQLCLSLCAGDAPFSPQFKEGRRGLPREFS